MELEPIFNDIQLQNDFDRDGYVTVDFLNADEVLYLLNLHRRFEDRFLNGFVASIMIADQTYRSVVDREVRDIFETKVEQLLNRYQLTGCGYVVKKALSPTSGLPIHQDWSFVDENRFVSLGIWCPLVDVDERNGCVHLLRGSQCLNTKPRGQATPSQYRSVLSELPSTCFTNLPMKAGQALLQSHRLFHGSRSNLSTHDRVATYSILIPESATARLYYQDIENQPSKLEVFEVADEFYSRYVAGVRPIDVKSVGFIDYEFDLVTVERVKLLETFRMNE